MSARRSDSNGLALPLMIDLREQLSVVDGSTSQYLCGTCALPTFLIASSQTQPGTEMTSNIILYAKGVYTV